MLDRLCILRIVLSAAAARIVGQWYADALGDRAHRMRVELRVAADLLMVRHTEPAVQ